MATRQQYRAPVANVIDLAEFDANIERIMASESASSKPVTQNRTTARAAGDVGLALGQGAVGAFKSISDIFGADNAVSSTLGNVNEGLQNLKSDQSKATLANSQRRIQEAEATGDWKNEVAATMQMLWDQPAEMLAQGAGSLATLGVGKLAQAAKLTQAAKAAGVSKAVFLDSPAGREAAKAAAEFAFKANVAVGAGQGVGAVKGSQYEQTLNAAKAQGMGDAEARSLASEAQAYGGPGTMQQLLGGVLGAGASATGPIERMVAGKAASKGPVTLMGGLGRGFATEGATEGAQGAQERYAGNDAAIDAGVLDESARWRGVAGQGVQEGVVGGLLGAGPGGLEAMGNKAQAAADAKAQAAAAAQAEADAAAAAIRANKQPGSGPLSNAVNAGTEADAQMVEVAGASAAAAIASAPDLADTAPSTPLPEGSAEFINPDFQARQQTLAEQMASPENREKVRARFGDEGLNQVLYYAQAASRADIPAKTADNMLQVAERMMGEVLLQPLSGNAQLGGMVRDPLTLDAPGVTGAQPLGLGLDQTPSGRFTVDAQGNAVPETAVQRGDAQRRAGEMASLGNQKIDILNPSSQPFKTRLAASLAAKKTPGEVVDVPGGYAVRAEQATPATPQQQAQPPAQQPILNNGKPFTLAEVGKANQAIGGTAVSVPGGWAIQPPQAAQKPAATPATAMPTDATPAASAQSAILGRNSQPIAEGGQPFATREEAKAEKRMQPLMRVAPAEGGGFILKPASERQLAAVEKAAKRLKYPSTGETGPRSLHGFILQIGGLASGTMPDIGFDLNPRVGNRRLFSPRGKTIEQAAMAAKQEGYIQDEDENTLIEALKRSLNVSPVYTPDGYEAMAEAQMQARYEDFLAAEQDGGAENDWSRLTPEELADTGYNDYDEATQAEIRALVAQAEALGVDAESILEDVARRTENATQKDYENAAKSAIEAAKSAIEAAIRSSEESRSRDLGQAGAEAGPATADTQAAPAAVTGPASDVRARNLATLKARMMGQTKPTPATPPAQTKATPAPEAGPTNQGATNGQGQETLLKAEQPTGADVMVSGAPVAEQPSDTTKPGGFTEKVRKAAGKVDSAPAQQPAGSIDGIVIKPGKGLIKGKFKAEVDGVGLPGDAFNTEQEAYDAALKYREVLAKRANEGDEAQRRKDAIAESFRNGDQVTNAQIESLGLKSDFSDMRWFMSTAADLFGLNSRQIRPIVKDLIKVRRSDMGTEYEYVPTRNALEAIASSQSLTSPTKADIEAQQARSEQAAKANAAQDKADAARAAKERERKDVAAASVAAADTFELGQDAMANLTGQQDVFGAMDQAAPQMTAEEAAAYLKDFVYNLDQLDGMTRKAQVLLNSPMGKSGRDTLLMEAFGISREKAHDINNRLDSRQPKKLRNIDMQEAFDVFPGLRKIVDDAIQNGQPKAKTEPSSQFTDLEKELQAQSHAAELDGDIGIVAGGGVVRYVSLDDAVSAAKKAIESGVKSVPFQIHNATGIRIGDVDRVLEQVNRVDYSKRSVDWLRQNGGDTISVSDAIAALVEKQKAITGDVKNWTERDEKGHPVKGIALYNDSAAKKLDAISWAITNLMGHRKKHGDAPLNAAKAPDTDENKVPLSSVIDKVNAKNGQGLTDEDLVPNQKPSVSRAKEQPLTPAATIRAAITKAYGNLLDKLEAKGLVTIAQTEREAIEAAAQARADKTGGDVERIKRSMLASVQMQRVWHGSPHRGTQQFSTEKIGTGEGAQAYGWGLYFADKREIAEHYRRVLSGFFYAGTDANEEWFVFSDDDKKISGPYGTPDEASSAAEEAQKKAGQLYEVEIPEDGDMLLWDKPLSEQPAPARNSAKTMKGDIAQDWLENELDRLNADWNELTGQELYKLVQRALVDDALVPNAGSMAEQALIEGKTDKAASLLLMDDGIKGIKYLDGTSRNAGDGSFNYVVFDGADTQIVDVKYSANGNIEGFFDKQTGKSFLVADNLTAASAPGTLMHEVGIHMAADGKLEPLFKRAGSLLKNGTQNEFIQRVKARMARAGETSDEEAAAYIVTEYENNRAKAPITIGKWLADLTAAVRAWLFSKGIILKADQLTVADIAAVARANARSMARGGPNGGPGGGIRRSFAGEGAATADKMALATARQRVEAGENAETVRKETGWFKGVDGKWRFEISDSDASIKDRSKWTAKIDGLKSMRDAALRRKFEAEEKRNAFLRSRGESPSRISSETKREPEFKALVKALNTAELAVEKSRSSVFMAEQDGGLITVGDVLDHPALFSAYPKISETRVAFDNWLQKGNAAYSPESNTITIPGMDDSKQLLTVLLHEIQHGIQNIEGFATGGSPDLNGGFSAYKRLAGEVESRNTEARQGMTDAQRRETAPSATADTPDSDVIVVFNGKDAMSAPAPANADRRTALPSTLNIDGKDRPTTNSKGQPIHPTEEGVRNFYRWFGESKAVDEQGRPLVMYHGTKSDITRYDPAYFGSSTDEGFMGEGFYAANLPDAANGYARGEGGNVLPVYLKAVNPFSVPDGQDYLTNDQLDEMDAAGSDSGVARSNLEDGRTYIEYSVKNPTQIKSATGNTGAFSPADPDIRFSRAADMAGNAIDKAKQTADKAMGKDFPRAASMPDLNDDQRSLLGKVGASQSPASDAIKAATDRAGLKIRQGMVDRFAALKELDEKALGQNFIADSITNSAWVLAKMSSAGAGSLNAMMKSGRIEMDAQQKVIGLKGAPNGGLTASLQKLGGPAEVERFFAWVAANRAEKLMGEGRENLFTPAEIAAGKTLNTGTTEGGKVRPALYSQVHAEFQQYRDDVLAIAEQTGIINSENRAMWRDEFYVPFYRVMEDDADSGRSGGNGLSRQEAYKKLKGGKQNLNDLMENTLMNFHHLLSASLKNQAAVQAIKNAEEVGIARKVPEARRDTKTSTFVLVDGKKVFYEVDDPLVFESITTLADPGLNNTAVRVMGAFKRVFTNMTTATPQFIIANTFRDLLQASATSPTSKNIAKNLKEGIQSYRDEKTRAEMLASGGAFSFGHIYGMGADEVKESLQKTVAGAGLISSQSMIPSILRKGWDAWGDITDLSENASRAATYAQNVEQMGKLRAAFEARDVMDFSQHGAWPAVRLLVRIVPFLNARLQGLDKLYRSGLKPSILTAMGRGTDTDKQAAARFAMVTGALTLATMALYLVNADDDEYKKLEEWQKDTYWFIRIGENAFFLPKPFEVGAIATIAERTLQQAMDDKATGKMFRERMWEMLMQTFAFNPTPQMFQPLIDVYANKDAFTGRDIESAGMERMSTGLRSRDTTTAPATALSAVSRVFGDESSIAVSPVQADHLIKGYLGGVGAMAAGWIDTMYRAATGQSSPDKAWSEYQPIRRFYRDLDVPVANTRYTTLFYDGLKEANRVYADVMELQKLGRPEDATTLAAEKRNVLQMRIALNAQQRRLTEINNRMKEVRRSDKDGEWKRREIDLLNTQKAMITERMGKRIEDARVQ